MKVVQSQKSRKNPKSNPFFGSTRVDIRESMCRGREREVTSAHRASKSDRERSGDRRRK